MLHQPISPCGQNGGCGGGSGGTVGALLRKEIEYFTNLEHFEYPRGSLQAQGNSRKLASGSGKGIGNTAASRSSSGRSFWPLRIRWGRKKSAGAGGGGSGGGMLRPGMCSAVDVGRDGVGMISGRFGYRVLKQDDLSLEFAAIPKNAPSSSMVIFRSLRALTSKQQNINAVAGTLTYHRSFLTASTSTFPSSYALLPSLPRSPSSPPHCFLSPLSKWIAAPLLLRGHLFLASPPWKLLQSSTPLHLRGNGAALALLRKRRAEALNRLNSRLDSFKSRIRSSSAVAATTAAPYGFVVEEQSRRNRSAAEEWFWDSFANWPNFISISRLVSGPFLGWMIVNEMYSAAFVGLAISGASDWLDGYVARKMKIDSVVGSYLDPLADKVLIASVAVAMVHMDLLHPGLVGLVLFRDGGLVAATLYHRARSLGWKRDSWYDFVNLNGSGAEKVEPLYISKVNTVFQLLLVAAALLQPDFGTVETQVYVTYLSWLVASTTVGSSVAYGAKYLNNRSALLARKS
ncbi:unnamed protein product [Linum tenue]|uniref:Cardiolipin synthase n=1 Tax=Linum tenue TaxID=586396 RepID=A0AAV0JE38_9ROSI|nr:unnamed protein product [Linum tenue]